MSGGMHYSQKCWQQHLKVTLVNLPTAGKYWLCCLTVSFSQHFGSEVFLSNFSLKESFVLFQSFYCTDIMIDIMKGVSCDWAPTSLVFSFACVLVKYSKLDK